MADTLLRDIPTEMKDDVLEIYRRGLAKTSTLGFEMLKTTEGSIPPSAPLLQPLIYIPVSRPFRVDMTKAKQEAHLSRYLVDAWGEDKVAEEMYSHEGAENHYCTGSKPHNFFRYRRYQGADTVTLRLVKVADIVTEARRTKWPEIDRSLFILYQNSCNRQKLSDICKAVRQCGKGVAEAWETAMWIEQHCSECGQAYDDRVHILGRFGRQYEKAPTTDGSYVHFRSEVARLVFDGFTRASTGPYWKAHTIPILDRDFLPVSARDYFLIKE